MSAEWSDAALASRPFPLTAPQPSFARSVLTRAMTSSATEGADEASGAAIGFEDGVLGFRVFSGVAVAVALRLLDGDGVADGDGEADDGVGEAEEGAADGEDAVLTGADGPSSGATAVAASSSVSSV